MNRQLLRTLSFAAFSALLVVGCAADPGSGVPDVGVRERVDTGPRDTGVDTGADAADVGTADLGPDVVSGRPHLEHVSDTPMVVAINSRASIEARYVDAFGEPVLDAQIEFAFGDGDPGEAQFRTQTSRTNEEGIASVELLGGSVIASFNVVASVAQNNEVAPITFELDVVPKDSVDYIFHFEYPSEAISLDPNADVYVFADSETDCDDIGLDPYNFVGAREQLSARRLADGSFQDLIYSPNRSAEPLTHVIAIAYNNGFPVSMGCTDGLPTTVEPGSGTEVDVVIFDLFPNIEGEYTIENEFDILEFLPPNVQAVIRIIGTFFESPATAIFQILDESGVLAEDDLPSSIRGLIIDIIDSLVEEFLPENVLEIFDAGNNIITALENLHLNGRMLVYDNADENGVLGCNTLVLDTIDIAIEIGDFEFPPLNMRDYGYQAAEGDFYGWISIEDSGSLEYHLNVQWFDLSINYGELAVFILETALFPVIFDDPSIDSMEEFAQFFIDCEAIADAVDISIVEGFCDGLLSAAAGGLRDLMTSQTVDSGSVYRLSTPELGSTAPVDVEILDEGMEWAPCELGLTERSEFETEFPNVEAFGGPARDRCIWNARFRAGSCPDGTGCPVPAAFHGDRVGNAFGACSAP